MKPELNAAIALLVVTCAVGAADWLTPDKPKQPDTTYGKCVGTVTAQIISGGGGGYGKDSMVISTPSTTNTFTITNLFWRVETNGTP